MKVLYLSYDGMTDPLGQSQVLPYLLGLSKLGHQIHLVSFEKPEVFAIEKTIIENVISKSNIIWHPQSYTKTPPIISTLKDLWVLHKICKKLHKTHKFDFIHCRSYLTTLIALKLKRKMALPFIFDMRGFWADERVEGGIWNNKNFIYKTIYRYFKKREIDFMNESAVIISLTNNAKNEIMSWPALKSIKNDKIIVIPCCADLKHFNILDQTEKQKNRKKIGLLEEDLVISYVGSLGTWYMADEMLQLFKKIKEKYKNAKLLLITTTPIHEVQEYIYKNKLTKEDCIIQSGTRIQMPELINTSNLSIFFVKPTYAKKASSPTKMGEILACGVPIICNTNIGDVSEIVSSSQCGICIEDFSLKSYQLITENIPQLLSKNPTSLRYTAQEHFPLEKGISRYHEAYLRIQ